MNDRFAATQYAEKVIAEIIKQEIEHQQQEGTSPRMTPIPELPTPPTEENSDKPIVRGVVAVMAPITTSFLLSPETRRIALGYFADKLDRMERDGTSELRWRIQELRSGILASSRR